MQSVFKRVARLVALVVLGYAGPQLGGAELSSREEALGVIRYRVPEGWTSTDGGQGKRVLLSPGADKANHPAIILLVIDLPENQPIDFRAGFDQAVKSALGERKILQKSDVVPSKAGGGYDVLAQNLAAEDKDGGRLFTSITLANLKSKLVVLTLATTTRELFDQELPTFNKFLEAVQLPTAANSATPDPLAARNGRLPQQAPAKPATAASPFKSPEEVLQDEKARRKPGTFSGNIYMADGRPFDLKGARLTLEVIGISKSGDRTSETFAIDVDKNGHYETRAIGGHYRLLARASIPFNGRLVDAGWLDMLDAYDVAQSTDDGIVKDFAFRISGVKTGGDPAKGSDYLGKIVEMNVQTNAVRTQGTVQVVLTPRTPAIDGTKLTPVVLDYRAKWPSSSDGHVGIPYALYTASARLVLTDGSTKPLKIAKGYGFNGTQWAETVDLDFGNELGVDVAIAE